MIVMVVILIIIVMIMTIMIVIIRMRIVIIIITLSATVDGGAVRRSRVRFPLWPPAPYRLGRCLYNVTG